MPGTDQQVDFYILRSAGEAAVRLFACRLIEKIFRRGHRVFVRLDSVPDIQDFDQLLWIFSQRSFVPHASQNAPDADEAPVVLGQTPDPGRAEVMVNLTAGVPEQADGFARIVEVISADESSRQTGRQRFRHYREQGFTVHTHDIAA